MFILYYFLYYLLAWYLFTLTFAHTVLTSPFMNRMTIYDLRARFPEKAAVGATPCKYYYMWHYYKNTRYPDKIEKQLLKTAIESLTDRKKSHKVRCILIMKPDNREQDMPHTIGRYIIMPSYTKDLSVDEIAEILNHELIHIDQRYRDSKVAGVSDLSSKKRVSLVSVNYLRRNNPDTDDMYYPGYMWRYSSEYPKNVNDIVKETEYEHPFEEEAYRTKRSE
jgi:hypothetical protein